MAYGVGVGELRKPVDWSRECQEELVRGHPSGRVGNELTVEYAARLFAVRRVFVEAGNGRIGSRGTRRSSQGIQSDEHVLVAAISCGGETGAKKGDEC